MSNKNFDTCVSFSLANGAFIGRIVRLDKVLQDILQKHGYPLNVSTALSETSALAVLLSSQLKYDGLFTLQLQGNGPVSVLVADVTSEHKIRACAKFDEEQLNKAKALRKTEDIIEQVPHLVGGGHMAFTIDQGPNTELYQGVVDIQGKTLSEIALRYFKLSEQIDTSLKLFVKYPAGESDSFLSAGIMLQKVPLTGGKDVKTDENEHNIMFEDAKAFISSLSENEVFDENLSSEDILYRLFHSLDVKIMKEDKYEFGCRCSKDKLFSTLSTFKKEDIENMAEDGKICATCHFCSTKYIFDKEEFVKH